MAMLKPTGLLLATLASASASAAAVSGLPVGAIGRGGYPRAIEMARGERLLCTGEGGGLRVAAGQLACMLHAQHHSRVLPDWLRRATSSPLVRSCMYGARYQVTGLASLFWPASTAAGLQSHTCHSARHSVRSHSCTAIQCLGHASIHARATAAATANATAAPWEPRGTVVEDKGSGVDLANCVLFEVEPGKLLAAYRYHTGCTRTATSTPSSSSNTSTASGVCSSYSIQVSAASVPLVRLHLSLQGGSFCACRVGLVRAPHRCVFTSS